MRTPKRRILPFVFACLHLVNHYILSLSLSSLLLLGHHYDYDYQSLSVSYLCTAPMTNETTQMPKER